MVKKIFLFSLFLAIACISLPSCLNNNDDEENIDEEWKALNESRFNSLSSDNSYTSLMSQSANGRVYWKYSTEITDSDKNLRITVDNKPKFNDTVLVRYEGWYIDKVGEKVIFDSTENPSLRTNIAYGLGLIATPYPNKIPSQFGVNQVIDGWTTILQDMQVGEEREVCVPQELGYGRVGSTYTPSNTSGTYTIIPAYTTLWFRIKLLKIISM